MTTPSDPTQPPFAQPPQSPHQWPQPEAAQPQWAQPGGQAPALAPPTSAPTTSAPTTSAPTTWQSPASPVGQPAEPTFSRGGPIGAVLCLVGVLAWGAAHAFPIQRLTFGGDLVQTVDYWLLPITTVTRDSATETTAVALGIVAHILCVVLALMLAIVGLVRRHAVWGVVAAAMLLVRLIPEIATVIGRPPAEDAGSATVSTQFGTWIAVAAIVLAVASLIVLLLERARR